MKGNDPMPGLCARGGIEQLSIRSGPTDPGAESERNKGEIMGTKINIGTVFDPNTVSTIVHNPNAPAFVGSNQGNSASGFIAGPEPLGHSPVGVFGRSNNTGVFGFSDKFGGGVGVAGNTNAGTGTGVHGHTSTGVGVLGTCDRPTGLAGRFDGNVRISGRLDAPGSTITCFDVAIANADCAEEFDLSDQELAEPGTVMCLSGNGSLTPSSRAYDKKVAGVISGAGEYKPGIVLDRQQKGGNRAPVALVGKVYCKVDADHGAIETGDLLTTSSTPGHAMKAANPAQAFGAVIGKALKALSSGRGLIPVLIALQ